MEIKIGGTIRSHCNVKFVSGKHNHLPVMTKNDLTDISAISQLVAVDFLAIPFTIFGDDLAQVRKTLGPHGAHVKLLAKIDTLEGVQNYQKILPYADGAIFVRNEIQWEMQSEKLMLAQKWAIQQANSSAKPIML